ncbi:MAG TPA: tetratricopeptide repeat protein [Candidatus Binatia bacterium]|nr:tetratricopeptide repeat protein [Candidatus Binatia bacterium]
MTSGQVSYARQLCVFASHSVAAVLALTVAACSMTGGDDKKKDQAPAATLQGVPAKGIEGVSAEQLQSAGAAATATPGQYTGVGGVSIPAVAAPVGAAFDQNDPAHHLARCREHVARGEWFDAAGDCKRASELAPASPEPHAELMRIYVTIQSFRDAAASAERVLEMQPDNAVAWYYLGWAHRGREDHAAAVKALEKAVALAPTRHEFVQALGITYCAADDFGRGIARLEQAAQMNPADPKARRQADSARAMLADKVRPYEKAVAEKPDKAESHARLGSIYQRYGLLERALAAYDAALAKIPEPLADKPAETRRLAAGLYYNRGSLYRDLARPELALPAFTRAYEIDASLAPQAYYSIGLVKLDQGDAAAAVTSLSKSVELAPSVPENREALARALEKAGRPAEAKSQRDAVESMRSGAAAAAAAEAERNAAEAAAQSPPPSPAADAAASE